MITFVKTRYPKEGDTICKNVSPNRSWEIIRMKYKNSCSDEDVKTSSYSIKLKRKGLNYTLPWMLMSIERGPDSGHIHLYFCGNRILKTDEATKDSLFEALEKEKKKILPQFIKNDTKISPQRRLSMIRRLKEYSK